MACYIATYGLIGLFVLFAVCCLLFSGTAIARFKRASGSCAGTKRQAVGLQPAEADHVPAWVHGFTNAREAIRWRCLSCHGGKSTTEGTTLRVRKDDLKVRDQKVVVNNAGAFCAAFCAVYSVLCILCCILCCVFCAAFFYKTGSSSITQVARALAASRHRNDRKVEAKESVQRRSLRAPSTGACVGTRRAASGRP
jgi:hypothetical protein